MPGKGAIMPFFEIDALLSWTITGLLGIVLVYGLTQTPVRRPTEEERLLNENNLLKKKYNHLFGQNRALGENNIFLLNRLGLMETQKQESQNTQASLNGELVRRGNQIRSLERRLWEERKR
jgi:hypothetical protein